MGERRRKTLGERRGDIQFWISRLKRHESVSHRPFAESIVQYYCIRLAAITIVVIIHSCLFFSPLLSPRGEGFSVIDSGLYIIIT